MRIRTHIGVASTDGRPAFLSMPDFVPGKSHDHPGFIENCRAVVMGRTTFDPALAPPGWPWPGLEVYVPTSRPLPPNLPSRATAAPTASELVELMHDGGSDGDVHLVGGPAAIQAVRQIGAPDRLEVVVLRILLGDGVPLSPSGSEPLRLALESDRPFRDGSLELADSPTP